MNPIDLALISGVALICGLVGQLTSKYTKGGCLVNLGSAFVGAVVGVQMSRTFGLPLIYNIRFQKVDFPVIWATIGSVLLVAAIGMLLRPGRR